MPGRLDIGYAPVHAVAMQRFDRNDERLDAFTRALWDGLVPESGECVSVQGELIRAVHRLQRENFRNGMINYYTPDEPHHGLEQSYYGGLLLFVIDTLLANRNHALRANDLAYFREVRACAFTDWKLQRQINETLERAEDEGRELTDAENAEIERLEAAEGRLAVEEVLDRTFVAVANWCLANPELFDRAGEPVVERKVSDIRQLVERRPPGETLH